MCKNVIIQRGVIKLKHKLLLLLATSLIVPLITACRSRENEQSRNVIVSAPANGIVRRVMVDPNIAVDKDAAIIEIAVQSAHASPPKPGDASRSEAKLVSAQTDLASAEGEANRIAAELRRIEPLVKRGLASQAELDKARSQSLDAQERVRVARERANSAEADRKRATAISANEEIVLVRAPLAGTVQAVSVHAGEAVVSGQPLATLVANT